MAKQSEFTDQNLRRKPLIGHVEAGLRSFDRGMPEEIIRLLTDALGDIWFITEEDTRVNLLHEGIPNEKINFVGNVMIDTLISNLETASSVNTLRSVGLIDKDLTEGYGVITLNRSRSVDTGVILSRLVECIGAIATKLSLIFSLHPRTKGI